MTDRNLTPSERAWLSAMRLAGLRGERYCQRAREAWAEEWSNAPVPGRPIPGPLARQVADVYVRLWTDDLVRIGVWPPR